MRLDLSDKKILVIDDFPQMRSSLRKMIQAFGAADVDDAGNGDDAVKKIDRKKYDIVLCDYSLGEGKDGQQILEEVKHRGLLKYSTVFMMITAETTSEMVMGAVEYYPDDYLTKPFTKEVLGKRLEKLMERKRDLDDIEAAVYKRQLDEAVALCDRHIEAAPPNLLEFLRLKSSLCLQTGRYADAEAVCEKVLGMRAIPWAMLDMAKVHYFQKNYLRAQDILKDLIESNDAYVEAYDWLAKCHEQLGELGTAQESLAKAAELSPKSVLRQKALGAIAHRNNDLDLAERSFSKVLRLGRHSIYKSPRDYTNHAAVLIDKNEPAQALKALGPLTKDFKNDSGAAMLGHAMEGMVYKKMNRDEDAAKALSAATALYQEAGGKVPLEIAMDLAKACLTLGDKETGSAMMKDIVRNHHDDDEVLSQVAGVYAGADLQDEGRDIIAATRAEIVNVNNKGVTLVKESKLKEAIEFFQQAADGLPDNKIIIRNTALAMIMYMERHGRDDKLLYQARRYLERCQRLDPVNTQNEDLMKRYKGLTAA